MLSVLRRKAQSPFIQATVVVISLVFIFWGVGSSRRGSRNAAVTVNDDTVGFQEYQKAYDRIMTQYREQFGGNLPEGLLKTLDIKGQAIEQLIKKVLIMQGAKDMGILVSDAEVSRAVQKMKAFQNNGIFDAGRYKTILSRSRLTPSSFEESMREDLIANKVIGHIGRFAKMAPSELQEQFDFDNEEIKLAYVTFAADEFKKQVKVKDEGLTNYFEEHKDNYKTDPEVKVEYLAFLPDPDQKDITVSDDDLQRYYQQHIDEYSIAEQRRARHILIKTTQNDTKEQLAEKRNRAEELQKKAKGGKDFAALAKQYSEGPSASAGGDLGLFARGRMVKPFDDTVFALGKGEVSDVVQTRFGFHVIKLEDVIPASTKPLAEVKGKIEAALKKAKARDITFAKADKAYEAIILAGSLEKFAQKSGVAIKHTGFFSNKIKQTGRQGIIADPAFLNAAFSLKKGELSSLIDLAEGYAILYAEDIKAPEIPPLADVRDQVKTAYINDRAVGLAREAARKMLKELKTGGKDAASFAKAAGKAALEVKETPFISRMKSASGSGLPNTAVERGFNLTEASPYPDTIETDGNKFFVLRLQERKAPAGDIFAQKEKEYKNRLLQVKKAALLTGWVANLRSKAEINVNKQLL